MIVMRMENKLNNLEYKVKKLPILEEKNNNHTNPFQNICPNLHYEFQHQMSSFKTFIGS